jgi:hypothetical protein
MTGEQESTEVEMLATIGGGGNIGAEAQPCSPSLTFGASRPTKAGEETAARREKQGSQEKRTV